MKKMVAVLAILLIAGVMLTGCATTALKESDVSYADAMVEHTLVAENRKDYDLWAKDMGDEMLKAIPRDKFAQTLLDPIRGKIGTYIAGSKKFVAAARSKGSVIVEYTAKFTGEDQVEVRMVFAEVGGQEKITGEWYDSAKLRSK